MDFLAEHVAPSSVAIDVGANVGEYTLWLAKRVGPQGRVLAYEPFAPVARRLRLLVRLNRLHTVEVTEAAVADVEGGGALSLPRTRLGFVADALPYLSSTNVSGDIRVPVVTLDQESLRKNLRHVSVLKVDAEGGDFKVLKGAVKLIERERPTIMVEANEQWMARVGSTLRDLVHLVRDELNYRIYLSGRGKSLRTLEQIVSEGTENLVCFPAETR
jgi:FkbM family methyltransferase